MHAATGAFQPGALAGRSVPWDERQHPDSAACRLMTSTYSAAGGISTSSSCTLGGVLTIATLGMFSYGTYSIGWAINDLFHGAQLELWAELGLIAFGVLLVLSAALVRVRIPGGLAFALGAMLGLQALAVHNAAHLSGGMAPQLGRGVLAIVLVGLTYWDTWKTGRNTRQS
jgi:hypothetical protein